MTTLSDGTTTLVLPDDLDWSDEFSWAPVVQATDYSITGALIVQTAARQTGRPITLVGSESRAWVRQPVVLQLDTWSHVAGQVLTLVMRGVSRQVMFRHTDAPAFDAREIWGEVPTLASQEFAVTLKFMEV